MRNGEGQSPLKLRSFLATSEGKEIRSEDFCGGSANSIIMKVTNCKKINFEQFTNYRNYEESKIFKQMFENTKLEKKEEAHLLFQISHSRTHNYLIEKVWDEIKNVYLYYIHQSYLKKFTLGQWEGTDPWVFSEELKQDEHIKHYSQYRERTLSLAEIQAFIRAEIQYQQSCEEDFFGIGWVYKDQFFPLMEVNAYFVDTRKLQRIERLINLQLVSKSLLTAMSESVKLTRYNFFAITNSSVMNEMIKPFISNNTLTSV